MLSAAILVVAAFGVGCLAKPADIAPVVDYGNANFYVDLVLFNINRNLPDNISITTVPPGVDNTFGAHNCFFVGLDNGIKRDGDATLVVTGNEARFNCPFKMQELGFTCDFTYLFNDGHGEGTTALVTLGTGMYLQMVSGQHPYITEWLVTYIDPVVVVVTGFPGVNWLIEDVTQWIMGNIEASITYVIENDVRNLVQGILDGMVVP